MATDNRGHPVSAATDSLLRLGELLRDTGYAFTTVTLATHERVNARAENAWARANEDMFGWSRRFRAGTLSDPLVDRMKEAGVLLVESDGWRSGVRLPTIGDAQLLHSAFPTPSAGESTGFAHSPLTV